MRLRPMTESIPKPMLEVAGRPFLAYVMDHLVSQGVERICLAVGYKADIIEAHFGACYRGVPIVYSREAHALGTGGALVRALHHVEHRHVIVANGDTLFKLVLPAMWRFHVEERADVTIAVKHMPDCARYGSIVMHPGRRIRSYREKGTNGSGDINGGIYIVKRQSLFERQLPEVFSFEKDILERDVVNLREYGFRDSGYFIDIGVPEDLYRARCDRLGAL